MAYTFVYVIFFLYLCVLICVYVMKLSIITINYNNEEGLERTLNSVCEQSYKEIEHIVIDGGSTDGSVDVIKNYVNQCVMYDVLWVSEKDKGVYNAMNKGIRKATGEYLLFLNSGDFLIASDVIERVMTQCNGADILCARCNVSDNGKVVWTSNPLDNVTFGTLYSVGLAHQSTFIKKTLFDTCGLYREDFRYNADIAFWYKAIIDNHATTQRIDVVTTDYNLDGISSRENQSEQYKKEMEIILAPYAKFIPDYEELLAHRREHVVWNWIKRNKWVYMPVKCLYKIARK